MLFREHYLVLQMNQHFIKISAQLSNVIFLRNTNAKNFWKENWTIVFLNLEMVGNDNFLRSAIGRPIKPLPSGALRHTGCGESSGTQEKIK